MNIGFACLGIAIPGSKMKSTILKNAITKRLLSLIEHNLNALESMIDYNIENGVKLFRISSDLIPFGSSVAAEQAVDRLIPFVSTTVSVHPTQLYELFGAAAGIIIALWTAKRLELKEGGTFLIYVAWFSAVRLAVLPLRALTYSNEIKLIAYPMLYLLLIVGSLGLIMNRRSNELKQSNNASSINGDG